MTLTACTTTTTTAKLLKNSQQRSEPQPDYSEAENDDA